MTHPSSDPQTVDLVGVLRQVATELRDASGADIVALYPYDTEAQCYYAPVALGLPEDDLSDSIPDMHDQLARYHADAAQQKVPADLHPTHYGPNVWLTITRRPLIAPDAKAAIDSSFIHRYHIQSMLGVPLVTGEALVALLYLDYQTRQDNLPERLASLQPRASEAATAIERARRATERATFATLAALAADLAAPTTDHDGIAEQTRQRLVASLARLRASTNLAFAVYQRRADDGALDLAAADGLPDAPMTLTGVPALDEPQQDLLNDASLRRVLSNHHLHLLRCLPLGPSANQPQERTQNAGCLLVLSADRLALVRTVPATDLLLNAAAGLIGGTLANQRLFTALEDSNRVLAALGRMSTAMLQPGATRQRVLDAVVQQLTDARVPEFDFQFASAFLIGTGARRAPSASGPEAGSGFLVRLAAGAATAESIDATPVGPSSTADQVDGSLPRVPRWAQTPNRPLSPTDVLVYVARSWQVVVIDAAPNGHVGPADFVAGYPPDALTHREIPAVRADGTTSAVVPAILLGPTALPASPQAGADVAPPFTLDGAIFDTSGHRDLVRVFVPFGLGDQRSSATGVLEAGYHRAHKRQLDRSQIEALRACAAQLAVALETARLYEEAKRHAEQLEITTDISRAIASSIDLDQTLRLIARNLVRLVDASLSQIALYEEDGSAWYGAAASDDETLWRRQRGDRPEPSFLFDVLDRRAPLVIDDAQQSEQVNQYYARLFGIRSLLALPLLADEQPIGAVVLAQREQPRAFTDDEVQLANGLAHQAAIAIKNARLHALEEEEHHIQKDVILVGFGQWGQKAYEHLLTLKQFFNFAIHVVEQDTPHRRETLAARMQELQANGDTLYWDSEGAPARDQLARRLESSCYIITYIATPAPTHLPMLAQYYDLSDVVVIEKPLGAPPDAYRAFLDSVEGGVQIVAADHYYFKLEVRLLQLLLTEERTLKSFLDNVEEIQIELLEERPLTGAAAEIGIIEDMLPHAFAIMSLFTPIDHIQLAPSAKAAPLLIGRQEPFQGSRETYMRLHATFPHQGRTVRLIIDAGKGIENSKWIKLSGEKRLGGRRSFYKFDFVKGIAVDGTQANLNAAIRPIREPGVPDNAHLTMLRHVIERRHPAVGILAIREAMRSNQRIQEIAALAADLLAQGRWTPYTQGQRPEFPEARPYALVRPKAEAATG